MDGNVYYLLLLISFALGAWIWARYQKQRQTSLSTLRIWIPLTVSAIVIIILFLTAKDLFPVNPDFGRNLEVIAIEIRDLLKQLPDVSVAEKHHKEIIDALDRGVLAHAATSGGITSSGAIALFLTLLFLASAIVIALFFSGPYWDIAKKVLVISSMMPALGLSFMATLEKVVGVDKLFGIDLRDMHLFTFKTEISSGTSPQELDLRIHVTADETQLDCGEGENYKIGPFADGTAGDASIKPDEKLLTKLKKDIEILVGKLIKNHLGQRPLGLILVGSADKRELTPPLFHFFGSNAGLAQARAEWVRKAIENSMNPKPKTILTLSSGPAHVGLDPLPEDLAKDRSVRVCAIWGNK